MSKIVGEPWSKVDLNSEKYKKAVKVPTNNHEETLQLLAWTVQETKPKIIWEFGPWMGHTTMLMGLAGQDSLKKIYACDNFKWQDWMNKYNCGLKFDIGESFLPDFEKNTEDLKEIIQGIEWNSDLEVIPQQLLHPNIKPNFIFVDFTREAATLELFWKTITPHMIPNETVLVFNWVWEKTEEFFKKYIHQLKPIANHGVAGSYLFVSGEPT